MEQEKLDKAKREANFYDLTVDNDVEARPDDTDARLALRQQQQTEALAAVAWWPFKVSAKLPAPQTLLPAPAAESGLEPEESLVGTTAWLRSLVSVLHWVRLGI